MAGGFTRKPSTTPSRPSFGARLPSSSISSAKRNKSILNFFQKTDGPPQATSRQPRITQFTAKGTAGAGNGGRGGKDASPSLRRENGPNLGSTTGSLFLEDRRAKSSGAGEECGRSKSRSRSRTPDDIWGDDGEDEERYNEDGTAVKRRKAGDSSVEDLFEEGGKKDTANEDKSAPTKLRKTQSSGPFIDESDSEEDLDAFRETEVPEEPTTKPEADELDNLEDEGSISHNDDDHEASPPIDIPPLVREATSHIGDEFVDFDFFDEEGKEEEFLEPLSPTGHGCEEEAVCPICQASLVGLNEMVMLVSCYIDTAGSNEV